jgi:hypothetical protein
VRWRALVLVSGILAAVGSVFAEPIPSIQANGIIGASESGDG